MFINGVHYVEECVGWGCHCSSCTASAARDEAERQRENLKSSILRSGLKAAQVAVDSGFSSWEIGQHDYLLGYEMKKIEQERSYKRYREMNPCRPWPPPSCLDIDQDFEIEE